MRVSSSAGARRWMLAAISLLLTLAVLELLLRALGVDYHLYPERAVFGWPEPQEIRAYYQLDPELLWVPKDYEQRLAGALASPPDIVFMGCSCTEQGTYPEKFAELRGRQHPSKPPLSYLNLGVSGWSSFQGLQQLRRDVVRIRPRIATIFYGWNDHWIGFGIEDKDVGAIHDSPLFYELQQLRLVQLAIRALVARGQKQHTKPPPRVSAEDFRANLGGMIRLARQNDIVPVLLTAPTSHRRGEEPEYLKERWLERLEDLVPLHQRYVRIVREVAATEGVLLCDLERAFGSPPRRSLSERYFTEDGIHLTEEGDAEIAALLLECLDAAGLLEIDPD